MRILVENLRPDLVVLGLGFAEDASAISTPGPAHIDLGSCCYYYCCLVATEAV